MSVITSRSILSVTSELPWPLDTGGKIRTFHLQYALAKVFDVRLIVPVASTDETAIKRLKEHGINVIPVMVGPRQRLTEAGKVLKAMISGKPYVLFQRHYHAKVRKALLKAALDKLPDLLYLDHLDSHLYRSLLPSVPSLLDLHNIYSLIVDRFALEQRNLIKRFYFQRETKLLRQVEQQLSRDTNIAFAVSQSEVEHYKRLGARSVHLIPNGVDCSLYQQIPCGRQCDNVKLLFLGTMSWGPNAHAASFLIESVLPEIRKKHANAELWIVGRNPPADVLRYHGREGVHVTGGVPEIFPYYQDAQFLVVPLESGGGTRLKILEAFAAGLPVISTPVGVEGIDAIDGEHLSIVDRPHFTRKILEMIDQPAKAQQQAEQARKLANARYDWNNIGKQAVNIIQEQIRAA